MQPTKIQNNPKLFAQDAKVKMLVPKHIFVIEKAPPKIV